jgi:hypothetical protein
VRRRLAFAVLIALAVGAASACGGADRAETAASGAHALVTHSREGGIQFRSSRLAVSTAGRATVRSEGCTMGFPLGDAAWKRLRRALERTDLSALAGEYPAPPGAADTIAEVIVAGRNRVHVGDFSSLPPRVRHELEPLVVVLGEIVARGERRCASEQR